MLNKRGSILVITLWIMAILTILALGIGFKASLEVRLSGYNNDSLQAGYLAKAGLVKAGYFLSKDDKDYDTLRECGVSLDEDQKLQDLFTSELGRGSFSVDYTDIEEIEGEEGDTVQIRTIHHGMSDEERKINIRLSVLKTIPDYRIILNNLGLGERIVDAIENWQNKEPDFPYYERGELVPAYKCRRADFEFVEELRLVEGVSAELYDDLKDHVTVYGNGKVNINTANPRVLNAIIGEVNVVSDIIDKRTADEDYFNNDGIIASYFGDWGSDIERINPEQYFTAKSDYFRINSRGAVRKVEKVITAVIKREPGEDENDIVYYHEH
ncbi:MAG: hypothetical protein ABID09_02195 [Candidatus Omnitrophota bacterium]